MNAYNKLVVFDCDGTLVDSQHMIIGAMHATYDKLKLDKEDDLRIRATVGLSPLEAMATLRPDDAPDFHQVMATTFKQAFYERRVTNMAEPDPLYPGARDVLVLLQDEGYLLGVATGNSNRGLARVIDEHSLDGFFVTLQTADHHPSKPHPSMMHTAIAEAGSHESVTMMIGDTSFDMMMARSAGCHAIGVNWGYHDEDELRRGGAHNVINAYSDVMLAVKELEGM